MSTLNVELLDNAIEWAKESAKGKQGDAPSWNQYAWFERFDCGTACCIAGYVATRNGEQPVFTPGSREALTVEGTDGVQHSIQTYATELLGITSIEAGWLFDGDNDLVDIVEIAGELKERYA